MADNNKDLKVGKDVDGSGGYEMAFFVGYQVEGCFSSVKVQKSSICSLTSE